jgi:hypothetical protein
MRWSKFWRKNRDKVWEAVKISACATIAATIITAPISELNFLENVSAGVVSFLIGVPLVYFLNIVFTKLFGTEIIDKSKEKAQLYNLKKRQEIMDVLIEPIILASSDSNAVKEIIAAGRAKNVNLLGNLLVDWKEYESETNEKLKAKRFEVFIADVKEARIAYMNGKNQTFGIHENEVASPKWVRRLSTAALMFVALGAVFQCLRMTMITWFFIILTGLTILPCVWFLTPFVIEKAKRKRKDNADKKKQNT